MGQETIGFFWLSAITFQSELNLKQKFYGLLDWRKSLKTSALRKSMAGFPS